MWPLKTVEGRTRQKRRRLWWVGEGQGRGGCCAYCTWNVMVSWWWDRDLIVNLRKVRAWTMKEEWHTTEIDEKNRTKEFPGNASGNPPFFFFPASLQVGKQSSSCKWADKFRRQACAKKKREHERKPLVACDKLVLAQFLFFLRHRWPNTCPTSKSRLAAHLTVLLSFSMARADDENTKK